MRYSIAMATVKSKVWWSWGACRSVHVCFGGGVKGWTDERAAGFLLRLEETVVLCDVTHTHTHTLLWTFFQED